MKEIIALFNKMGGVNLLKQYLRAHVFMFAVFQILSQGFSKKSLEIVRLSIDNKILSKLRKQYRRSIREWKAKKSEHDKLLKVKSNKVWVCWLQGIHNAPALVQKCYSSLQENLIDREIILLTEENYMDYVRFPSFIQKKIDSGIITKTHMSDLLRLELLIRYGGTWVDATVFCSGSNIPDYMVNSDLFVFQNLKPGLDGHCKSISSWFMTSCTNNPVLLLTRELLYKYWERNNKMVDYFLIHLFFQLALEAYPDEWSRIVPFSNSTPHILLLRLFEPYSETVWKAVTEMTPFHKMTYKFTDEQTQIKETYYDKLFR